ncbi:hypothetical protein Q7P37_003269 [Cladosporium fusiforme]
MAITDPLSSLDGDVLDVTPGVDRVNGDLKAGDKIERLPNVAVNGSAEKKTEAVNGEVQKCDVLVVGAGFSGITAIHRFRKLGMKVKCFEGAGGYGGTWYWNRYPGARVDSETPFYQLNIPEVYKDWNFTERFADHTELRRYFDHCDKVLDLSKDTTFNARVNDASWDEVTGTWTVKTESGHSANCKYLFLATGSLHRKYTPDLPGLKDFKGTLVHSGEYPQDLDCTGKKVAIIGAGATAVQITQELGKVADETTIFLRRPSYCLPMGQRPLTDEEQKMWKAYYPTLFGAARQSPLGFPTAGVDKSAQEATEEERQSVWEEAWDKGAFHLLISAFNDTLLSPESNRMVYDFWRNKVLQRLTDPKKQALMAPEIPPYYIGTKRFPLEMDYYDVLAQDNVHLVDLTATPLKTFEATGMKMSDDVLREFDVVVLATGFDSFTGSLTHMGLKNKDGVELEKLWKDGVYTYLGLTVHVLLPQSPGVLSNGTVAIEAQVETIVDMIAKLEKENAKSIEARHEAEIEYKQMLEITANYTLIPQTSSWWNAANIPGKRAEGMTYVLGIQAYEKQCRDSMEGWKGFDVVPVDAAAAKA